MGRAFLTALLGGLLVAAAVVFGPAALLLPGCALVILVVLCVLWVLLAGWGRLERQIGESKVVEGEPCRVMLSARTLLPTPAGSELLEPLAAAPVPARWRRRQSFEAQATFARRGRWLPEPARLVVRDPLGVAAREVRSAAGPETLVLPRIEPVRPVRAGAGQLSALTRATLSASEEGPRVEFDTLREARPETPATRIHWASYARTGTLAELSLLAEIDRRPLVALDAGEPQSDEALDAAVRAAASLAVALARGGGCDLLLPGERRPSYVDPTLAAWPSLHARLALVEAGGHVVAPSRLGHIAAVFWVTAAAGETATPPRELVRGAATTSYLVVPGPPTAASLFTVAGCHGRPLRSRGSRRRAA